LRPDTTAEIATQKKLISEDIAQSTAVEAGVAQDSAISGNQEAVHEPDHGDLKKVAETENVTSTPSDLPASESNASGVSTPYPTKDAVAPETMAMAFPMTPTSPDTPAPRPLPITMPATPLTPNAPTPISDAAAPPASAALSLGSPVQKEKPMNSPALPSEIQVRYEDIMRNVVRVAKVPPPPTDGKGKNGGMKGMIGMVRRKSMKVR